MILSLLRPAAGKIMVEGGRWRKAAMWACRHPFVLYGKAALLASHLGSLKIAGGTRQGWLRGYLRQGKEDRRYSMG